MKQVDEKLLSHVNGALHIITEELSKPQEDVVAISVCGTTRGAIQDMLKLFLVSNGISVQEAGTIDDLVRMCVKKDDRFLNFDFSVVYCRCESSNKDTIPYCMSDDRVQACYQLLLKLKEHVYGDLEVN